METVKVKFELTDNLIGINGLGTYHGYFNPDYMIGNHMIENDINEGYNTEFKTVDEYWVRFDHDLYNDRLVKLINNQVSNLTFELNYLLNKYHSKYDGNKQLDPIEEINCVGINIPKYYNYRDDWFELDFIVNYGAWKQSIWNIVNENLAEFDKFLKEEYSSCDGFISYTANNYSEWERGFNQDREQEIGAALSFIINTMLDYSLVNDCLENSELFYLDFIK